MDGVEVVSGTRMGAGVGSGVATGVEFGVGVGEGVGVDSTVILGVDNTSGTVQL